MKFSSVIKIFFSLSLGLGGATNLSFAEPVRFDRTYSKVETHTGEHCAGWEIELWKMGSGYVGKLFHHRGLCGDPPLGILREIKYNSKDGAISFVTTLSDGTDARGQPTCDVLEFAGTMTERSLVGAINWKGTRRIDQINLDRGNGETLGVSEFNDYQAWLSSQKPVLDTRGPGPGCLTAH